GSGKKFKQCHGALA
ncbi:SEC-C metal-binding domain-containing protein, partial [Pararhodobacter sp.]